MEMRTPWGKGRPVSVTGAAPCALSDPVGGNTVFERTLRDSCSRSRNNGLDIVLVVNLLFMFIFCVCVPR